MYGDMEKLEAEVNTERRLAELEIWRRRIMKSMIKVGPFALIKLPFNDEDHKGYLDA